MADIVREMTLSTTTVHEARKSPTPNALRRRFRFLSEPATWRAAVYLALTVPLGLLWLLLVAGGLAVGGLTALLGIGVVVLLSTLAGARALGELERHLVNALLDARVPAPPVVEPVDWRVAARGVVTDPRTWRSLAWLLLRGLAGVLVLGGAALASVVLAALVVVPFVDGYLQWGASWRSSAGWRSTWTLPLALVGLLSGAWLLRQVAAAHVFAARLLLGPDAAQQAAGLARQTGRLAERARLARDLHDNIGHSVTVMVLQAESARRLLDTDPDAARASLETIGQTGRRAMSELDTVLAVLAEDATPVRKEPTLADLPELLRRAEAAGMAIRAEVKDLDQAAEHPASAVAFRVVQESCTNALRHAKGCAAQVEIQVVDEWLVVEVRNATARLPPGQSSTEPGRGLAGLDERVRLAGGRLTAGPEPDGGWRVRAELPHEPRRANPSR